MRTQGRRRPSKIRTAVSNERPASGGRAGGGEAILAEVGCLAGAAVRCVRARIKYYFRASFRPGGRPALLLVVYTLAASL